MTHIRNTFALRQNLSFTLDLLVCVITLASMTLKEMVTKGGYARAAKLTKERRIEIAKLAGQASALARQLASKRETCQSVQSTENKV